MFGDRKLAKREFACTLVCARANLGVRRSIDSLALSLRSAVQ
jgi:hypothetical protein